MKQLLKSCLLAAGLAAGTSAHAGLITSELNVDQFVEYGATHTYTHNVSLDPNFSAGDIVSGELSIELIDTNDLSGLEFLAWMASGFTYSMELSGPDYATIIVEGLDGDTGEFATVVDGMWSVSLGQAALAALNADGMLDIAISGFGLGTLDDLNIGRSTLTLETRDVPLPATLALFGLGLAGLGLARRKNVGRGA